MRWFYNLKLSKKLIAAFLVVAGIAGVIGFVGVASVQTVQRGSEEIYKNNLVPVANLSDIGAMLLRIRIEMRDAVQTDDPAQYQKRANDIKEFTPQITKLLEEFNASINTDEERQALDEFKAIRKEYLAYRDRVLELAGEGKRQEAAAMIREKDAIADKYTAALDAMRTIQLRLASENAHTNAATAKRATQAVVLFLVVGVAFALALGFVLARLISKPMQLVVERVELLRGRSITQLGNAVDAMAHGDLSYCVESTAEPLTYAYNDEVGALATSVNGIIGQTEKTIRSFEEARATVRNLCDQTTALTKAAEAGNLQERGKPDAFRGAFAELVRGLNNTLDAVISPVTEASRILDKLAARDLRERMTGAYHGDHAKIKDALNTAIQNLEESLSQVARGAEQVGSAAGEISTGSQALAHGASTQASSLEEISSSLQEVASMTRQNAANSKEARSITEVARTSAERGTEKMEKLSAAIEAIKKSADATARIVKTIDEIAFQTNLLALNAAVEAARAGDAGKGFAVVAEEVRSLASRSAEAAKHTANLIDESVKNADDGVQINLEVSSSLKEIHDRVNKVSEVMAEIAAASEQQNEGVDQINKGVEQMNHVTQQTAANAEESASASEQLSAQAQEMLEMVGHFRITNSGEARLGPETARQAHFERSVKHSRMTVVPKTGTTGGSHLSL